MIRHRTCTIRTDVVEENGSSGGSRAAEVKMIATRFWPVFLLAWASVSALAADARERGFIRKGMGEGEVVLKIGKPDHEAFHRDVRGEPEEKTWTYFPHARDPQTVTIIRFHSGVVADIQRKIAR
jgi:hypothetical protein